MRECIRCEEDFDESDPSAGGEWWCPSCQAQNDRDVAQWIAETEAKIDGAAETVDASHE